jgi:anti-anti-sigma factor
MNIKVEQYINIKTIKIIGPVIITEMGPLRKELVNLSNVKEIHIDLTETNYIDSSFLGLILHAKIEKPEIEMKILNPNEFLLALLDKPEYKEFFTIIRTE